MLYPKKWNAWFILIKRFLILGSFLLVWMQSDTIVRRTLFGVRIWIICWHSSLRVWYRFLQTEILKICFEIIRFDSFLLRWRNFERQSHKYGFSVDNTIFIRGVVFILKQSWILFWEYRKHLVLFETEVHPFNLWHQKQTFSMRFLFSTGWATVSYKMKNCVVLTHFFGQTTNSRVICHPQLVISHGCSISSD